VRELTATSGGNAFSAGWCRCVRAASGVVTIASTCSDESTITHSRPPATGLDHLSPRWSVASRRYPCMSRSASARSRLPRILAAIVAVVITPLGVIAAMNSASAAATVFEAENATLSQATVATNHPGFTGTGFVDYNNVAGSYVEWTVGAAKA